MQNPLDSTKVDKVSGEDAVIPGRALSDVLQLEEEKAEVAFKECRSIDLSIEKARVLRVLLLKNNTGGFRKDLNIVKNELVYQEGEEDGVYLDFIYRGERLVGVVPVVYRINGREVTEEDRAAPWLLLHMTRLDLHYYDFSDLWFDMNGIQPGEEGECDEILPWVEGVETLLAQYLRRVYGDNAFCVQRTPRAKFVLETVRKSNFADGSPSAIYYYQPFGLAELLHYYEEAKATGRPLEGTVYVSLPSAYVPGKFIDIEYYNAIVEEDFGLEWEDSLLVIGYGAGVDLIHAARKCGAILGLEVNPFSVASARTNYRLAQVGADASLLWEDARTYLRQGSRPDERMAKINKLLWNMPYENEGTKGRPVRMHDFYDNYSVLEWFLPLLAESTLFRGDLVALLWNLGTDEELLREWAESYGFGTRSDRERNILLLSRRTSE